MAPRHVDGLRGETTAPPAELSYRGHVLMENPHELVVDCRVTLADGFGERDVAQEMAADCPGAHRKTIGADKGYDTKGFVGEMRRLVFTSHVAQNTARSGGSAIDGRCASSSCAAKRMAAGCPPRAAKNGAKALALDPEARYKERLTRYGPLGEMHNLRIHLIDV